MIEVLDIVRGPFVALQQDLTEVLALLGVQATIYRPNVRPTEEVQ